MSNPLGGIIDRPVAEMPIAIFDFETTGLTPGVDRVVEVSIMHKNPGAEPKLILDTLINPQRSVAATEIHGITDEDVADAPSFDEVAGDVVRALSGCVVAAYNVYFDMRFLEYELQRVGIEDSPPHFCLMYLRPMLGLGKRCSLDEACQVHGIDHDSDHIASGDVMSATRLIDVYLDEMRAREVTTFGDLASLKKYKFVDSFHLNPIAFSETRHPRCCDRLKPRGTQVIATSPVTSGAAVGEPRVAPRKALGAYWEALKATIWDLEITDEEIRDLEQKERQLGLKVEQIRALHARVFAGVISRFVDDQWLDNRERRKLHRLHQCLSQLGWAPGE